MSVSAHLILPIRNRDRTLRASLWRPWPVEGLPSACRPQQLGVRLPTRHLEKSGPLYDTLCDVNSTVRYLLADDTVAVDVHLAPLILGNLTPAEYDSFAAEVLPAGWRIAQWSGQTPEPRRQESAVYPQQPEAPQAPARPPAELVPEDQVQVCAPPSPTESSRYLGGLQRREILSCFRLGAHPVGYQLCDAHGQLLNVNNIRWSEQPTPADRLAALLTGEERRDAEPAAAVPEEPPRREATPAERAYYAQLATLPEGRVIRHKWTGALYTVKSCNTSGEAYLSHWDADRRQWVDADPSSHNLEEWAWDEPRDPETGYLATEWPDKPRVIKKTGPGGRIFDRFKRMFS
jgi:hypothetical protein